MRALTIKRPWAGLIALGLKTIEWRGWETDYRGPLAIVAAKGIQREVHKRAVSLGVPDDIGLVAVVDLVDVIEFDDADSAMVQAATCGLGETPWAGFAWLIRNPRMVTPPLDVAGQLGLPTVKPSHQTTLRKRGLL